MQELELEWDAYNDAVLTDFVFDSNLSTREIAQEFDVSELIIKKRIRDLNLSWVRRKNGHLSRGQGALTTIMRKLLPNEKIVTEEPIGERLRLDVYCPAYKLAAEYHGRQHFQYVQFFHGDKEGFYDSQARDERKLEICKELGIILLVFRYTDVLTEDAVFQRMLDAIRDAPPIVKAEKKSIKGDPYYESWKQRQREYRKQSYRKMKKSGRGI